ncbi:zinc ribbon domain-containing protein [Streptomyces sp. NPDC126514]|uniref:zinc ribbon domain-containing protein n=1 Tax=Streptomyces sp. NPDC126514 TaxID=3155210 RepID=UPI00331FADE5
MFCRVAICAAPETERYEQGFGRGPRDREHRHRLHRLSRHQAWAASDSLACAGYGSASPNGSALIASASQTRAECGHRDQRSRVGQRLFICRGCGGVAHADRNVSHTIATRGESVRMREGGASMSFVKASLSGLG